MSYYSRGLNSRSIEKSHRPVKISLLPSSSLDDFSGLETDTALPMEEDYVVYDDGMEPILKNTLCFLITRSYFNYKHLIVIAFFSGSN